MRKAIWALPLATALAAALTIPSAYAATGTISSPSHYDPSNDTQVSFVAPMNVGDCTQFGNLYVSRPDSTGFTKFRFLFTTLTSHTNSFDQWHNSWKFLDSAGRPVGVLSTIDGLRMPSVNTAYSGEILSNISMTNGQWASIAQVVWTGSC